MSSIIGLIIRTMFNVYYWTLRLGILMNKLRLYMKFVDEGLR